MKIAVAIATTGRSAILRQTLVRLARQTRQPDHVMVVGAQSNDCDGAEGLAGARTIIAAKGSSKQRNRALDLLETSADVVIFLDDDFVPAEDFVAGVEYLMDAHPDIVAASGHLLADGFRSAGVSVPDADALIEAHERKGFQGIVIADQRSVYGCNMAIRTSALGRMRFDENLPLYGWLEDLDLSARLVKRGRIVRTNLCVGVHLGTKTGRSPGLRLGYSQIANPLYLAGKKTMGLRAAFSMVSRNVIANSVRSLAPETYIDRRGRLKGNLLAIGDLILGRNHPTRVLELMTSRHPMGAPRTTH